MDRRGRHPRGHPRRPHRKTPRCWLCPGESDGAAAKVARAPTPRPRGFFTRASASHRNPARCISISALLQRALPPGYSARCSPTQNPAAVAWACSRSLTPAGPPSVRTAVSIGLRQAPLVAENLCLRCRVPAENVTTCFNQWGPHQSISQRALAHRSPGSLVVRAPK